MLPTLNCANVTALVDRSLRDLVPVLDRYRPAALAATAIIVAVGVLPGATGGSGLAAPAAFDAGFVDEADEDVDDDLEAAAPSEPTGELDGQATAGAVPVPRSTVATPAPSFPSPPASPAPAPSSAPPPASTFDPAPSTGADDVADDAPEELRIVAAAYASSTGGTPLPTDVPEGSLPVGARVDQMDKASYLRLDGSASALVLNELADGRRGSEFESSPVQACQITDAGWEPAENMAFSDAPAHDPEVCVLATILPDGRWSIPLDAFADPTDDRGIALVPAPDAPIDFQVTFAATVAT